MLPAQLTMALLGGFLAVWAATLILRALARRFEQASIRRLKAANLPIPNYASQPSLIGPLAALTLGIPILLAGLLTILLSITMESWMLHRPSVESLGGAITISSSLLILLALASTLAGWFFDPSRGRPRCPTCWYDLHPALARTHATDQTAFTPILCSECGHTAPRARDLYRTRRKSALFWIASLALVASYFTYKLPAIRKGGFTATIPSTVLIAGFDWLPDSLIIGYQGAKDCLAIRDSERQLWKWQQRWLESRADRLLNSGQDIGSLYRGATFASSSRDRPIERARLGTLLDGLLSSDHTEALKSIYLITYRLSYDVPDFTIDQAAVARLPRLVALLDNQDSGIADAAGSMLTLAGPAINDHLDVITAAIERRNRVRPQDQLLALLAVHSDKLLAMLITHCENGTDASRKMAIQAARRIAMRRPELAPTLLRLTEDPSASISYAAINAVNRLLDPDAAVTLIVHHINNYRGSDRDWLLEHLFAQADRSAHYNPDVVTAIRAIIADTLEGTDERISAARKLALFGRDPQSHALIANLKATLTLNEYQIEPVEQALSATKPP